MNLETWTDEYHNCAVNEGWILSVCEGSLGGILQVQKFDESDLLSSDQEAWRIVKTGSKSYHKEALKLVAEYNPTEYGRIINT